MSKLTAAGEFTSFLPNELLLRYRSDAMLHMRVRNSQVQGPAHTCDQYFPSGSGPIPACTITLACMCREE